jgi:hypothetical protein
MSVCRPRASAGAKRSTTVMTLLQNSTGRVPCGGTLWQIAMPERGIFAAGEPVRRAAG